ncbi:O-methyltransferase [Desulfobacterota bacterium AH_259_B03_O07]|nr:O-methyltransferase [Desulfobacterota bacterium AH_259_B03_O07]
MPIPENYIVNPKIEEYLTRLTAEDDTILNEMENLGKEINFPIIGPLVGKLLSQLALTISAKTVFEMGSGFGYSTYWFAKAVGEGGTVFFTDLSETNSQLAQDFFRRGDIDSRIKIETGDSLKTLDDSPGEFDIIFNDIDKEHYPLVVKKAYNKLRPRGLFITDNVLWFGRILSDDNSPSTKGVREFTRLLLAEKGFLTTIIPIRDGISLSLKL